MLDFIRSVSEASDVRGDASDGVLVLTADDVGAALPVEAAIVAQREAFRQLWSGAAVVPPRTVLDVPGGTSLFMPGVLAEAPVAGLKVVSVIPGNPARGLSPVLGAVLLLDPDTGRPTALMDATFLTALRTAAGSALATDLLADEDASVLTVFGAGAQAREHIRALRAVRPIREVRIVSRTVARARALAGSLEGVAASALTSASEAVRGAHVVVTATNSPDPVFDGRDLDSGAHVVAIGAYTPETREVDEYVVTRARIVVDTREGAMAEAGDLLIPIASGAITPADIDAELGEIVSGVSPAGRDGRPYTFYKSVGNAAQDLMTAHRVFDEARRRGLGTLVSL